MASETIRWHCDGHDMVIGLDRMGTGPTVLMLPALSSISTRRELHPLQLRLADEFEVVSIDWPGFGDLPKPFVEWRPDVYERFVAFLFEQVAPAPFAVVAAGHAAGYVTRHLAAHDESVQRLVLLSPTWRGPLPTMTNGKYGRFPRIAKAVDLPLIGPLLYQLNVNRAVVGMMARGHVYADPDWLDDNRMQDKLTVTRVPGARHSSVRFVAGCVDPFSTRNEQLDALRHVQVPMLNVFADTAPRKSRGEMEAIAELPGVETIRLPLGKLSFYEEFPERAAEAIRGFLSVDAAA